MFRDRQAPRTLVLLAFLASPGFADDPKAPPQGVTHRITGLCCRDREDDLRRAAKKLPGGIELLSIDFEHGEATFAYDRARAFPEARSAEEIPDHLNNLLRNASTYTFGVRRPSTTPSERLTPVEIAVVGLDCKACSLAAYEAIAMIDGVEYATASFKDGLVTARIDPEKTNRPALEAALKARGVQLKD